MYRFITDDSHGWLKVKTTELNKLNLSDKISSYSYISPSKKYVYLEEDCDCTKFMEAKELRGESIKSEIRSKYCKGQCYIRGYDPFIATNIMEEKKMFKLEEKTVKEYETIVASPGKFQGEKRYVPYYWDIMMDGWFDYSEEEIEDGRYAIEFGVTAYDKSLFPELQHQTVIQLFERSDGFIVELT